MRVWEWRWDAVPKVRTDNALANRIQAQGASPRTAWARLGSKLAGWRGRPRPAPRGTRPPGFSKQKGYLIFGSIWSRTSNLTSEMRFKEELCH